MLETLFRHLDMVRLSATVFVVLALISCTGLIDGGSDGLTPQERVAHQRWADSAYPVLHDNCHSCHNGSRANVEFLEGEKPSEVYSSIKAFDPPVINVDAPGSSRILSKGLHDGPMLTGEQSSAILTWIQAERDASITKPGDETQLLATTPFAIQMCIPPGLPDNPEGTCPTNHVPLDMIGSVGMQIPGAEIAFTAQAVAGTLYLTNLKLIGGTAGTYVEHPLFVSINAAGERFPDQIDRFFSLKMNLKAGTSDQLNGGTAVFVGFGTTDQDKLEVHFKTLSPFKPDTGPGTADPGGCKAVDKFKSNVVPALLPCSQCHKAPGNANARANMDITGYDTTDAAMILGACNQVRTRVNLTTTDQSAIYLAPDPASTTNHPFKFPVGQFVPMFKTSVDVWVQAEKTAP